MHFSMMNAAMNDNMNMSQNIKMKEIKEIWESDDRNNSNLCNYSGTGYLNQFYYW